VGGAEPSCCPRRDAKAAEYRKSLASRFRPARGASTGASRAPPPTSDADAADDSVDGARGAPGSTRERAATRGGAGLRAVASLKPAPFQRPIPTKVAAQVQRIFSGEGIDANNEDAEVDATAFMRDAAAFPGEWNMGRRGPRSRVAPRPVGEWATSGGATRTRVAPCRPLSLCT